MKKSKNASKVESARRTSPSGNKTPARESHPASFAPPPSWWPADSQRRPKTPSENPGFLRSPPVPNFAPRNLQSSSPSAPPTAEYEPLEGGTGKEVYYRQARFLVADLLGPHTDIDHTVNFAEHSGTLIDFGINGAAFSVEKFTLDRDYIIEDFTVTVGGDCMYEGRARVRYCRHETRRMTVGVVLLDGILDTDAIVLATNRALAAKTSSALAVMLRHGVVSQEYKSVLADLTLVLHTYRELMLREEQSLESLSTPNARSLAEQTILETAARDFMPQYRDCRKRCQELTAKLSPVAKEAYRAYTKAVLYPYVLSAPNVYQACQKPLGYPGDFMLMLYMYDPMPYGTALFDKLVHQTTNEEEPMAVGVRKRKQYLLQRIESTVASHRGQGEEPCRVMSLACGPAQEVIEFVSKDQATSVPVQFTLIDQDQRSLTHVNSSLSRLLIPGATNIEAKYLYLGFKQMIAELDAFDALPPQNLIYAAGLFDYIKTPTAQRLARRLFRKLEKGGKLLIGNFKSPNDGTWSLDYWMDWRLLYRTHEDMHAIAARIDAPHTVSVESDESNYTYILTLTRC